MRQAVPSTQASPHVCVLDDDASVRDSTADLLSAAGFACDAFASAQDFLDSGLAADTSCVVADVQMPGMTGMEMLERLRTDGVAVPVILMTAFPHEALRVRALRIGAIAFLDKPV